MEPSLKYTIHAGENLENKSVQNHINRQMLFRLVFISFKSFLDDIVVKFEAIRGE